MKKYITLFIAAAMLTGSLSACGSTGSATAEESFESTDSAAYATGSAYATNTDSFQIVTTIFPEYDWVMNILGKNPSNAEVTMLLDNGVDLHSYQPTADDIMKISTCDLFVYAGGESDEWVEDALKEVTNKDMVVIDLLDVLGESVKEEEVVEGMQAEEHDHDHEEGGEQDESAHEEKDHEDEVHEEEHDEEEHEHEEVEYDEHVWLSLRNSAVLVNSISEALQSLDTENADLYKENTEAYTVKISELDDKYQATVTQASVNTLLFGDRFPFRYLVDDYGLDYYAAFAGCSAETEASFETIIFLAQKVDELSLHSVMTIEGTDHKIAETIIENTQSKDQQILTMDSMQSTTAGDVENGTTYLSIMEKNLEVLREALK